MSYLRDKLFTLPLPVGVAELEPWRKALLDAAEYIRVHGHCKGRGIAEDGSVCAIGALHKATGGRMPVEERFILYDKLGCHTNARGLVRWNDAPERTKEDVIRALTECARS